MTIGLLGRKMGMTRIFTDDGLSLPVSVVEVLPNRISQLKNLVMSAGTPISILQSGTKN